MISSMAHLVRRFQVIREVAQRLSLQRPKDGHRQSQQQPQMQMGQQSGQGQLGALRYLRMLCGVLVVCYVSILGLSSDPRFCWLSYVSYYPCFWFSADGWHIGESVF